jgi:tetratricopeptide (TPR) repeat protein
LKILEENGKDSNYFQELTNLALLQIEINEFVDAEKNLQECLKHFKLQKDPLGKAAVYGLLGVVFFKSKEYDDSIESYNIAYKIYKELNQHKEEIICLIGMGNALIKLNEWDKACDIFLECSTICSKSDDIYNLLDCLGNLIHIHEMRENWDVVKELYKKTLEAFEELRDFRGIITSNFNLGILEKKENNYQKALNYFEKGTQRAKESNYSEMIIKGLSYIGEVLFYLGNIKSAKNYYIEALKIAKEVNAKNAIIQINVLLNSFGLNDEQINKELNKLNDN